MHRWTADRQVPRPESARDQPDTSDGSVDCVGYLLGPGRFVRLRLGSALDPIPAARAAGGTG